MVGDVVLGLRPRLVAGVVLTSAATLPAAALFLLPPLEHRLRQDQLASLVATARTARSSFADLGTDRRAVPFPSSLSHKGLLSRGFKTLSGMPQNFLACDREQPFLLPPDVRE